MVANSFLKTKNCYKLERKRRNDIMAETVEGIKEHYAIAIVFTYNYLFMECCEEDPRKIMARINALC